MIATSIQGRQLFKGGNYSWKYGTYLVTKGQKKSLNGSFKPTVLPKSERTNLFFMPNSFVRFLEEFEDTKKLF